MKEDAYSKWRYFSIFFWNTYLHVCHIFIPSIFAFANKSACEHYGFSTSQSLALSSTDTHFELIYKLYVLLHGLLHIFRLLFFSGFFFSDTVTKPINNEWTTTKKEWWWSKKNLRVNCHKKENNKDAYVERNRVMCMRCDLFVTAKSIGELWVRRGEAIESNQHYSEEKMTEPTNFNWIEIMPTA